MKVAFTETAEQDLAEIQTFIERQYAEVSPGFESALRRAVAYIATWPSIAPHVEQRPEVRGILIGRFPYKLFFRIREDMVEILHVHHTARQPWHSRA
jgi:plasmid stabilization system protein ParE